MTKTNMFYIFKKYINIKINSEDFKNMKFYSLFKILVEYPFKNINKEKALINLTNEFNQKVKINQDNLNTLAVKLYQQHRKQISIFLDENIKKCIDDLYHKDYFNALCTLMIVTDKLTALSIPTKKINRLINNTFYF